MSAVVLADKVPSIVAPSISYHALLPIFIVLGGAMLGVLVEAVVPRKERFATQLLVTFASLIGAGIDVCLLHNTKVVTPVAGTCPPGAKDCLASPVFGGSLAVDGVGLFIQGTILALAIVATLLLAERSADVASPIVASAATVVGSPEDRRLSQAGHVQTEIFPMLLFAVGGMLIFPIANNLILLFVALEVFSLPLYLMAGLARRRRLLSQKAAMKYFLLGAFASAFLLYGIAL
ncbi:MAG TPA: proton-conducting transporter membrane subunit, partial [Burkholderiaceae bacterium]|nr:proton-conducting transporter membrane subunit [Burkholderiaceae bacterium]